MIEHKLTCYDIDFEGSWIEELEDFARKLPNLGEKEGPRALEKKKNKVINGNRLRKCGRCGVWKGREGYHLLSREHNKTYGLQPYCKECNRDYQKKKNKKRHKGDLLPLGALNDGFRPNKAD